MTGQRARLARLEAQAIPTPAELAQMSDEQLTAHVQRLNLSAFAVKLNAMTDAELLSEWTDREERRVAR
jgi:hypothetical protein